MAENLNRHFQRDINDHKMCENMINEISREMQIKPEISQLLERLLVKRQTVTSVGEDMEKRKPLYNVGTKTFV
jgi:hypothetical protein